HAEHGEARRALRPRVAREAARFAQVLREHPRTVVAPRFTRDEQITLAKARRRAGRKARQSICTGGKRGERTIQRPGKAKLRAAPAAEVAELRMEYAELVIEMIDQLGNQEIQIGVALPVAVRRQVDRHAFDARLKVGAVIEIEPAHEILIRLSFARVLRDD